jgi:S-adenosylmethionine:tRNA ribosyltransferase-isomerase
MLPESDSAHSARPGTARADFPVDQLQFELPEALIAQEPSARRTDARLLVVERESGRMEDRCIPDFPSLLRAGDALVLNDTRVLPAKFVLRRVTGGRIRGLFIQRESDGDWTVLLRGAGKLAPGESLQFCQGQATAGDSARAADGGLAPWVAELIQRGPRGRWRIRVRHAHAAHLPGDPARVLHTVGRMPLPPYIGRGAEQDARDETDRRRYQTVYAAKDGAIAAPTAGLHFTAKLLDRLSQGGIEILPVTLHVGYGTFAPIEVDNLAEHDMHAEYCEISTEVAAQLRATRAAGGRVVAVGTTSARVLESAWRANTWQSGYADWTRLFCYPPCTFGGVDALLTNFHLPGSTLIALVMAFAGIDHIRAAYAHAIEQHYRFFSYGDAMLLI